MIGIRQLKNRCKNGRNCFSYICYKLIKDKYFILKFFSFISFSTKILQIHVHARHESGLRHGISVVYLVALGQQILAFEPYIYMLLQLISSRQVPQNEALAHLARRQLRKQSGNVLHAGVYLPSVSGIFCAAEELVFGCRNEVIGHVEGTVVGREMPCRRGLIACLLYTSDAADEL